MHDLAVLFEHPEWQKPLFAALEKRGIDFLPIDLKTAAFREDDPLPARVVFNQASPSAYVRGNTRAVPLAMAYMQWLETRGAKVLNGTRAFRFELSKSAQAALLRTLGIDTPRSIAFNSIAALKPRAHELEWPALLKPEQGGSGARIHVVDSFAALETLLAERPQLWEPDGLLLLQEYLRHDPEQGIVRLEILGGELLYGMRVVSHGRFNLCPSEVCNPGDGSAGHCDIPAVKPVEFFPYEAPKEAVRDALRIFNAAGLDVGGIEYLETPSGRRVFYDVNANSNLRPAIAAHFGVDPFERVVEYLAQRVRPQ